jgi:hypothetical protein
MLFNTHLCWAQLSKSDAILPIANQTEQNTIGSVCYLANGRFCNASMAFLNQTALRNQSGSSTISPRGLNCTQARRADAQYDLLGLVTQFCDPPRCHGRYCLIFSTMCQDIRYRLYDCLDAAFARQTGREERLVKRVGGSLRSAFKPSLDKIETVLAPEHFVADEKCGQAEDAARNRAIGQSGELVACRFCVGEFD